MNKISKSKSKGLLPLDLGQSLFEVVVATGLSAIILAGIVSLAAASVRNSSFTRNNAQATKYAQEEVEWLRSKRDAGWDNFVGVGSSIAGGGCEGTFSWGGNCVIDSVFTRNAAFSCFLLEVSSGSKLPRNCVTDSSSNIDIVDVIVTVSWTDSQGVHETQSKARFTDWKK